VQAAAVSQGLNQLTRSSKRFASSWRHTLRTGNRCRDKGEGNVDQRALVERAGRGDHDAFAALATAASARLDAAARLILRDRELARDAVQNTLVRAWRDLPGLRDPDRFDAWLHRLLVNSCLDEARRRRRWPIEVDILPIDIPTADEAQSLADRDLVERALRRLDPPHRALVILHYFLGYPLPDAAQLLGISLPAAKSRLHRAMTGLRRVFEAESIDFSPAEGGRTA
jgi:RNA polymerase sigma factor (sigma-70 family)